MSAKEVTNSLQQGSYNDKNDNLKYEKSAEIKKENRTVFDRDILTHRQKLAMARPKFEPATDVTVEDILVQVQEDKKLPIKRYIPINTDEDNRENKNINYPTVFYIPGTAFVAIEIPFTHVIASQICSKAKCQVIVINHRLAPEAQFPAGFLDVYSIYKYFVKMAGSHSVDVNRLAVMGYSSGGNFAALLALAAKRDSLPLARQILISPIVDLSRSLDKFKEFEAKDSVISEEFVSWFLDLYIPEKYKTQLRNPKMSPFWNKDKEFEGLPPTDIVWGEYDRFRSDAEYYYLKLQAAGIHVERKLETGENHSYLWYKLEIIEQVATRLKEAFSPKRISYLSPKHHLSFIKPHTKSLEILEDQEEKKDALNDPKSLNLAKLGIRAKL